MPTAGPGATPPVETPPTETPPVSPPPAPIRVDSIYVADADGTVRGPLFEGDWPSWSPDGRRLVFTRNGRVRVIDADGSNEKDLGPGAWPAWSPDGSRIAFVPYVAGFVMKRTIEVMSPDGSATRTLLEPTVNKYDPCYSVGPLAWSPDGASIAFVTSNCEFPCKIVLVSADGTGEHRLTAPTPTPGQEEDEGGPSWSPDGSRIVYVHSDFSTGDGGLSIIDPSGRDSRPLAGGPKALSRASWSPDGHAITFNSPDGSIMIVPSSGGSPRRLILDGRDAAWSADGKRIAFVRVFVR